MESDRHVGPRPDMSEPRGGLPRHWRNDDVDWDRWPVTTYLTENYRNLHACDDAVLVHHSAFYRGLPPGSLDRTVEIGAGPNLYPLMLACGASLHIDAVDRSSAGLSYLRRQLAGPPDESWNRFWQRCRELNPTLPHVMNVGLDRVTVVHGDAFTLAGSDYDLASMHFVAESATEHVNEFAAFCTAFATTVRPGGHLVAAFMENMGRYQLGDGSQWPGTPVDVSFVRRVFQPHTDHLHITRIDADPDLPDYGYTGMILLTAQRRKA